MKRQSKVTCFWTVFHGEQRNGGIFIKIPKSRRLLDFIGIIRSVVLKINPYVFPISIVVNSALFLYAIIKATLSETHHLWFASLSFWYLLMAFGKIQLLNGNGCTDKETEAMRIVKRTRIFMIIAGLVIFALSVQVYFFSFDIGLSASFVILNGSYVVIKLIFRCINSWISKKNKGKSITSVIDVCRRKLTAAESMFAFSLIFYKLIAVYNWNDKMLSLMAMVYGGISGTAVIVAGVRHEKTDMDIYQKCPNK